MCWVLLFHCYVFYSSDYLVYIISIIIRQVFFALEKTFSHEMKIDLTGDWPVQREPPYGSLGPRWSLCAFSWNLHLSGILHLNGRFARTDLIVSYKQCDTSYRKWREEVYIVSNMWWYSCISHSTNCDIWWFVCHKLHRRSRIILMMLM